MCSVNDLCSIIILSYNQLNYTKQCLESIRKYTNVPYEIIIIDNASAKETVDFLEQQPDIVLIKNKENKGFAGGCNQGIEIAQGKYLVLLNNDTIVTQNWLFYMKELLDHNEDISMVGPLTNNTVGKQKISVSYEENEIEKMHEFAHQLAEKCYKPFRTLRLVAFCIVIRKKLIEEIGTLDEHFEIGNYEDDDFNIRSLLANKKSYICRKSFIHHFMNISFHKNNLPREEIMMKNKLRLEKKWNQMDWNHHAVFNQYLLERILAYDGKDILHIGCGLGALAIELKDFNPNYRITGIESHSLRFSISQTFLDYVYKWDEELSFFKDLEKKQYDVVIVECMLEKSGLLLLDKMKSLLKENSLVFIRVFNIKHITTIERLMTGKVEGNLLCASSKEFEYYFDETVQDEFKKYGYSIIHEMPIIKSFSYKQKELLSALELYSDYTNLSKIYNRIYELKKGSL